MATLEDLLETLQQIESIQRQKLELARERASTCAARTHGFTPDVMNFYGAEPMVAKMIADETRHLTAVPPVTNPSTKPRQSTPLFPKQEQTEVSRTISEWAAKLAREQMEFESKLPQPPTGFAWVRHDKWPDIFDADRDANSYVIETEYTLEPLPGFPSREDGAR